MDPVVEEIALVPNTTHNQDGAVIQQRKLYNKVDRRYSFNRIFDSKKSLKPVILWIILFFCVILIAGPLAFSISNSTPTMTPRNAAKHIFSEERARDYLINLTQYGSRVANTRGNFQARRFLLSQIQRIRSMNKRNLQIEIDLQNFTDMHGNRLQNILVRVSNPRVNTGSTSSLMLSAHYDSVEFSPGSSDDGSGVVILLELLSNLINDLTLTFSDIHLIILLTDGEEMGSEGAVEFIRRHRWRFNIRRFINVDAINCNEVSALVQVKPSELVMDYRRVSKPRANVLLEYIPKWSTVATDYNIFEKENAVLGYDFGFFLDGYFYHTPLDQSSFIKHGALQELGDNLRLLSRNILMKDTHKIEDTNDDDPLIYFDIFGRYLFVYKMSTSMLIQRTLIILILIVSTIRILLDYLYHRQLSFICNDIHCIYSSFQYATCLRCISFIIFFISNIISIIVGLFTSEMSAWIMSKIRPLAWYGNSILVIFLFSLPCFIGFITIAYLWSSFHQFILKKWPKNPLRKSSELAVKHFNKVSFDFEQNLSLLLIYVILMIISIYFNNQIFYIILVWTIFICPIYLLIIIIEFIIHWKQIQWNFIEQRYHWLYLPLIISLFPLIHTIEICHRLLRILIPLMARGISIGRYLHGDILICSIISVFSIFAILSFIPILQRIKSFGRILIMLLITFFITVIITFTRQSFTNIHPNIFYAFHTSKSIYTITTLSNISLIVPLTSQTSMITILSLSGRSAESVVNDFSMKSGYMLHNKQCLSSMNCTFDDTFNRTIAIQDIHVELLNSFRRLTIIVRHVLAYSIHVSSLDSIILTVRSPFNKPRIETIIDVELDPLIYSFDINVLIIRCDLNDSPFLLLFNRSISNTVLTGMGLCYAIQDDAIITFNLETLSN